jgi:hypothetical protein
MGSRIRKIGKSTTMLITGLSHANKSTQKNYMISWQIFRLLKLLTNVSK